QFLTDLRADELHPLDGNFLGRVVGADQLGNPAAHVGVITGQTDHDVRCGTEVLHYGIAKSGRLQRLAHSRQIYRLAVARSEEHTSELQSRENLVCRLLLEKNKTA